MKTRTQQIEELQKEWTQPRWEGITRPYSAEEVVKLRVQAGWGRQMPTWHPACIRINRCTRQTLFRR